MLRLRWRNPKEMVLHLLQEHSNLHGVRWKIWLLESRLPQKSIRFISRNAREFANAMTMGSLCLFANHDFISVRSILNFVVAVKAWG